MNTPHEEGRAAGYRASPAANPYRKGIPVLWTEDQILAAQQWDAGYLEGQQQANDDLIDRRREACR